MNVSVSTSSLPSPIDFYFDFSSPYGYFGALHIEELAAQYGRQIHWHPILLGPVFKLMQTAPLVSVPLKGDYARHDIVRTARFHNILFQFPDIFPISSQHAARAVLWVQKHHAAQTTKFIHKLYRAYFTETIDISQAGNVVRIAGDLGIDTVQLNAALHDQVLKAALKAEVDAAIERGVFGSPFVIADGEPFWGFDRFYQLEIFLQKGKIE